MKPLGEEAQAKWLYNMSCKPIPDHICTPKKDPNSWRIPGLNVSRVILNDLISAGMGLLHKIFPVPNGVDPQKACSCRCFRFHPFSTWHLDPGNPLPQCTNTARKRKSTSDRPICHNSVFQDCQYEKRTKMRMRFPVSLSFKSSRSLLLGHFVSLVHSNELHNQRGIKDAVVQ